MQNEEERAEIVPLSGPPLAAASPCRKGQLQVAAVIFGLQFRRNLLPPTIEATVLERGDLHWSWAITLAALCLTGARCSSPVCSYSTVLTGCYQRQPLTRTEGSGGILLWLEEKVGFSSCDLEEVVEEGKGSRSP
ncbi:hypothetical protein Tsubulata_017006 [Turnera subulata]|uniref:Uncharacterized protein n=1 Tax=Turnera subulata TaxID=218843 RepID=A0A9Q0J8Q7_9ROSI|nr:hypothetical protein Tsubulata_017006 [Turnera subulata]